MVPAQSDFSKDRDGVIPRSVTTRNVIAYPVAAGKYRYQKARKGVMKEFEG